MNTTTNRVVAIIIVLILMLGEWWILTRPSAEMAGDDSSYSTSTSGTASDVLPPVSTSDSGTSATNPAKTSATVAQATTMSSGTTVSVLNQPAGNNVTLSMVTVVKPTWVAVVDTNDKILGARRFDSTQTGGDVVLLRPTKSGQSYQLYMYVDDGDKAFDAHKDALVTDAKGQPASLTFTAQ